MKKNSISPDRSSLKKYAAGFIGSLVTLIVSGNITCHKVFAGSAVSFDVSTSDAAGNTDSLDFMFLLAFIALVPTFLMMMTCFTRIVISFSFLRNAIGTQNSPPNQVIVGLSLFISLFIMLPVFEQIRADAYEPYKAGLITSEEAIEKGSVPLKEFMLKQVYEEDLDLFVSIADERGMIEKEDYSSQDKLTQLSIFVITPAFVTSELKRAFLIGFLIYIPFLIIDLVVSSTLMAMGMVMLPPAMISLPFKLMLFIAADGWDLLIESLITSFN